MKKLLFLLLLPFSVLSQDTIVTTKGEIIVCKVTEVYPERIYYITEGKRFSIPTELISEKKISEKHLTINKAEELEYSEVVKVDSTITKDELFNRARSWFVDYYKNAKEVLQVSDKESGELQGAPIFEYGYKAFMRYNTLIIDYRVIIQVKDGRYKVKVYQFYNSKRSSSGYNYDGWGNISKKENMIKDDILSLSEEDYSLLKNETEKTAKAIFNSLKGYMNKPATKEEDW